MTESHLPPAIQIETKSPPTHAVIWLHGLGADGSDFAPIVSELQLPASMAIRFIFPHAPIRPITINNGYEMRGWYDISSLTSHRGSDEEGITESIEMISDIITRQVQLGIPMKRIVIGGFSQGAVIALRTGLHLKEPLAGILALSGYLPLMKPIHPEGPKPPIFLAHGTADTVVSFALGELAKKTLQQAGLKVEWHTYAMGHSVCAAEINDIAAWLQSIFS